MTVVVERGEGPVVLAFPHTGTDLPDDVRDRLNDTGRVLADTDWHVDRLYAGLLPGATTVRATFHRYVIDANRDPAGSSLYPGRNTTALVPTTDFDGRPIWRPGAEPDAAEIERRRAGFHAPYHAALAAEIERVRARHGVCVLYDCHSIRSTIPFLFDGLLPDFNVGTDGGRTADPALVSAVMAKVAAADCYAHVLDGRFRGGWTTRWYGRPEAGVHAIQMELAQRTHLAAEAPPFAYDAARAGRLRVHLAAVLTALETTAHRLAAGAAR
ncbi:N-formylglutamate deformylase [Oharaeibacter diazotrophicus]|uniref:Formiminoglutamase n=1 Tax=Oharaeibacter diazotrophicus TaxID=1920512 RepID=A0A4V3CVM9_9HYPH|nr:N-formylglutamate deformylase [Oharaeibacter diazotrophicus]TDP83108.1 formiminoglutamase [Oharaeibacter diazotrophicus]BBE71939.1 N-formylglutamate amidohydrolase [Pleomorphomonas sp. SM30]GLS78703.1 N-formylglutamate deformylase [Oharaeibacter diazotrophicus]